MMYVVFLTIYQYAVLEVVPGPIRTEPASASSLIAIIPVMCFAYQVRSDQLIAVIKSLFPCFTCNLSVGSDQSSDKSSAWLA